MMINRVNMTISAIAHPGNAFFSGSSVMADAGSDGEGAGALNPLMEIGGGAGGAVRPLTAMDGGGVSTGNPVTVVIILLH
jgi:hypothetical protein